MLQKFRRYIKGWVAFVIFFVISLTFVLWGVQHYIESRAPKRGALVNVYGKQITQMDVASYAQANAISSGEALEDMILAEIVRHNFSGLTADNGFSILRSSIKSTSFVLPSDVSFYKKLVKHFSRFKFLDMTSSDFKVDARKKIDAASFDKDKKIKAYYQAHQADFHSPVQDKYEYILVNMGKELDKFVKLPSESQMKVFYENNKNQSWILVRPELWVYSVLTVPVKDASEASVAVKALSSLSVSDDFSALLKQHPLWHVMEMKLSPTQVQSFNLPRDKERLSTPRYFAQDGAVATYRLKSHQSLERKTFDDVKSEIKTRLLNKQKINLLAHYNQKIRDFMIDTPGSLQPIASGLFSNDPLPIKATGFINEVGGSNNQLFALSEVQAEIKRSLSTVRAGDVLRVDLDKNAGELTGHTLLFRLQESKPSVLKPLSQVKKQITDILVNQQARLLMQQFFSKVTAAMNPGVLPGAIQGRKLNWQNFSGGDKDWVQFFFSQWLTQGLWDAGSLCDDPKFEYLSACKPLGKLFAMSLDQRDLVEPVSADEYIAMRLNPLTDAQLKQLFAVKGVESWVGTQLPAIQDQLLWAAVRGSIISHAKKNIIYYTQLN